MDQATLIIDVRSNRGGHVSELVIEKLARRITGWDIPRWMTPSPYPRDAPRGPVVALADENAGSDGDFVTAAIRILGLAPVVGARTWGGVIGIDAIRLVDGTAMTVRGAIWLEGSGWGSGDTAWTPTSGLISPRTGLRAGCAAGDRRAAGHGGSRIPRPSPRRMSPPVPASSAPLPPRPRLVSG
jgi:tricorn protease